MKGSLPKAEPVELVAVLRPQELAEAQERVVELELAEGEQTRETSLPYQA